MPELAKKEYVSCLQNLAGGYMKLTLIKNLVIEIIAHYEV